MSGQALLIDTQVLLWWVLADPRLSDRARAAMQKELEQDRKLLVSVWSIVELGYGTEKPVGNPGRIDNADLEEVLTVLDDPESEFAVVPVSAEVAKRVRLVPRSWNSDPWDRTIMATTLTHHARLVTRDATQVRNEQLDTLW